MSPQEKQENIKQLAQRIASGVNELLQTKAGPDRLIHTDLVLEDLRQLYRLLSDGKGGQRHFTSTPDPAEAAREEKQALAQKKQMQQAPVPSVQEKQTMAPQATEERPEEPQAAEEPSAEAQEEQTPATPKARDEQPAAPQVKVEQPAAPLEKTTPKDKKGKQGKLLADQFVQEDNSLHSRVAGKNQDKSIGLRLQRQPINSLKQAIGVNEKFLFINELFGGNIKVYHDVIDRLDQFTNAAAAFDYLNQLTVEFGWDESKNTATVETLATYVERRFSGK